MNEMNQMKEMNARVNNPDRHTARLKRKSTEMQKTRRL
jgi:hypothetical protein